MDGAATYSRRSSSAGKDLETPLRFTYTIQDQNDPSWVHLDYVMIGRTGEIDVDEGALDVRRVTSGKHSGRTRVIAKKAILFVDPCWKWPTVACDTFWMDLVIDAAVGCLGRRRDNRLNERHSHDGGEQGSPARQGDR